MAGSTTQDRKGCLVHLKPMWAVGPHTAHLGVIKKTLHALTVRTGNRENVKSIATWYIIAFDFDIKIYLHF